MGNFIDLTGQRFGRLTVIEKYDNNKWKCQCECGNIVNAFTGHLNAGNKKSCGCNKKLTERRKPRIKDLTGMTFGWITVKKIVGKNDKHQTLYLIQCKCGEKFIRPSSEIRRLNACYSCRNKFRAIEKNKKEINKKYNMLTILDIYFKEGSKSLIAKTQCECGNIKEIPLTRIKSGQKSCGCIKKLCLNGFIEKGWKKGGWDGENWNLEKRLSSSKEALFRSYKKGAKERKLNFEISSVEFFKLTSSNCFYCGKKPSQGKKKDGYYKYNGIDRKDSSLGYTLENSVPCCWECNKAKNSTPKEEFLSWIEQVYKHSIENNTIKESI